MKVWVNGNLVDKDKAALSVFDHGVLYGDGVFEGIRAYGGRVFECQAHIDRLFDSAKAIRLSISTAKQELVDAMYQTLAANGLADGYIRLLVTRGPGNLGLNPFLCCDSSVVIIADEIRLYPREMYEHGMAVIIAQTRRTSASMVPPSVKSLNYLNNILAKIEAVDAGVAEAIMLNADGNIAEATGDNIFIVRGGTVITPPPAAGILIGITRKAVMRLCGKLGIPLKEADIRPEELRSADECFLTGTAAEVIAVTKVDEGMIGGGKPGPITLRLQAAFRELVQAK